jgi:hypothetical protein
VRTGPNPRLVCSWRLTRAFAFLYACSSESGSGDGDYTRGKYHASDLAQEALPLVVPSFCLGIEEILSDR